MIGTLLIDGDMTAFRAMIAAETEVDWGDDVWTLACDHKEAWGNVQAALDRALDKAGCDKLVFTFSDDTNWRKQVVPSYKANRKSVRKPVGYRRFVEKLKSEYDHYQRPTLEADDIMGILATHPGIIKGRKVIYTDDKDLKGIPGELLRQGELTLIEEAEADLWHLVQSLAGDITDGFSGCPGIGVKKAQALLEPMGPRQRWGAIVKAYEKAGLSEEVALSQARLARMCRHTDYDFKKKEVILWTPH